MILVWSFIICDVVSDEIHTKYRKLDFCILCQSGRLIVASSVRANSCMALSIVLNQLSDDCLFVFLFRS